MADSATLDSQTALNSPSTEAFHEIQGLKELLRLADGLPKEYQGSFYRVLDQLAECLERRQRMLGLVQDSLNQMSLDLKYLIFDLEATRRERDEYRYLLENRS